MMKDLMTVLALTALVPNAAHTADRATVAEQVAEKCRKEWPTDYTMQLMCRETQMEAFDKLEQQDRERAMSVRPEHASCQRAVAALKKMPEVEVLDERAAHFAYKPGGSIRLDCAAAIYLIMGVSPLPGPEFWPFFGRLARVVGVEPSEAIKAAQACRTSGERKKAKWQKPNEKGLFAGDLFDTPTLHVDCRVSDNFLSLGVFKPPGE